MRFYAIILFVAIFNLALNLVGGLNIFGYQVQGSFGFPYDIPAAAILIGGLMLPLIYHANMIVSIGIFFASFGAMLYMVNNTLNMFGLNQIAMVGGMTLVTAFDILMTILATAAIIQILSGGWKTYE